MLAQRLFEMYVIVKINCQKTPFIRAKFKQKELLNVTLTFFTSSKIYQLKTENRLTLRNTKNKPFAVTKFFEKLKILLFLSQLRNHD